MSIVPDDPRLTAYALGQLDAADRPEIEALLARDPEARAFLEEVRETARLLTESLRDERLLGRFGVNEDHIGVAATRRVERLACATEDMKTSLRSFRKYVPADLVRKLMQSGQEARLGGEEELAALRRLDDRALSASKSTPPAQPFRRYSNKSGRIRAPNAGRSVFGYATASASMNSSPIPAATASIAAGLASLSTSWSRRS